MISNVRQLDMSNTRLSVRPPLRDTLRHSSSHAHHISAVRVGLLFGRFICYVPFARFNRERMMNAFRQSARSLFCARAICIFAIVSAMVLCSQLRVYAQAPYIADPASTLRYAAEHGEWALLGATPPRDWKPGCTRCRFFAV
jgi:hypothetical protein